MTPSTAWCRSLTSCTPFSCSSITKVTACKQMTLWDFEVSSELNFIFPFLPIILPVCRVPGQCPYDISRPAGRKESQYRNRPNLLLCGAAPPSGSRRKRQGAAAAAEGRGGGCHAESVCGGAVWALQSQVSVAPCGQSAALQSCVWLTVMCVCSHPSRWCIKEILEESDKICFYSFLMSLSKSDGINQDIGEFNKDPDFLDMFVGVSECLWSLPRLSMSLVLFRSSAQQIRRPGGPRNGPGTGQTVRNSRHTDGWSVCVFNLFFFFSI